MPNTVYESTMKMVKHSEALTENIQKKVTMMERINKSLVMFLLSLVTISVYWLTEPDPLLVEDTGTNPEIYFCDGGSFQFTRHVTATKPLTVRVEPKLVDLFTDSKYVLESKVYEGGVQDGITTYRHRVSSNFSVGLYEYMPTAIYDVNPLKTITKDLPTQTVYLNCATTAEKHREEMLEIINHTNMKKEDKIYFIHDILENK